MKRIFLSLFLLAAVSTVMAQGNLEAAKAKLEKSNLELQNPAKAAKASTWLKNAELYLNAANVHVGDFFPGLPAAQLVLLVGKPLNAGAPPIVTLNGEDYTKYQYPAVDAYVDSKSMVKFFVQTKNELPDALAKAEASAKKALEVDPATKPKVSALLSNIVKAYASSADNNFNIGNFKTAAADFIAAGVLGSDANVNYPEANELLYYGAASAVNAGDFNAAKAPIDMLVAKDYIKDGYVLYYKGVIEDALGNKAVAEEALVDGFKKYPANDRLLNTLVSFYIRNNEDPNKVIPYIKMAQEQTPNNVVLFLAEGLAYDSMKDYPKAVAAYKKAVSMVPGNFDALYNLSLAQYKISEKIAKELEAIDYSKKDEYAAKMKDIEVAQTEALGFLLKAHEINSKDINTVELIRSIYFRQRNASPEMKAKYEEFNAKLIELKK